MFGKNKFFPLLTAGVVAVALSAALVIFTGCPEEPAPMEDPMEAPEMPEDPDDMDMPEPQEEPEELPEL